MLDLLYNNFQYKGWIAKLCIQYKAINCCKSPSLTPDVIWSCPCMYMNLFIFHMCVYINFMNFEGSYNLCYDLAIYDLVSPSWS